VQFERLGYFVADRYDYSRAKPVFNRTATLRDSYATR
jgi:glutaminyl-tRNA synthetase